MATAILATKLYIPQPPPRAVVRLRLVEMLNEGLHRKLTLICAPAGFGKSTLVSAWVAGLEQIEPKVRVAWLSLEAADSDPARFLAYFIAAVQTIRADFGASVAASLQAPRSPQVQRPPAMEVILTALLNEIAAIPADFVLVLDDYHLIDSEQVDGAVAFLVEHLPPHMHLAIATREDPQLPLSRLRARGHLAEIRAEDLRFTTAEAAEFLNRVMDLDLSSEDIAALEGRTEGWIVGLQLAALALQGIPPAHQSHQTQAPEGSGDTGDTGDRTDRTVFIKSFTGSHHFVLDYLLEEVLARQPESVQAFLLRTSILDRMCGPLCEAVVYGDAGDARHARDAGANLPASQVTMSPQATGQETLEYLERANLFVVPLDGERRWYRYHHLFADLLRQRLHTLYQQHPEQPDGLAQYHTRASVWYEANGLEIEAFRHAAAANDIERAERLAQGGGIPLHSLAAVTSIIGWLDSLPKTVLDARPWLWVRSATLMLMAGVTTGVEEKLHAAEVALAPAMQTAGAEGGASLDSKVRDLIGQIASVRATLAILRYEPDAALTQSRRALEYLQPDNLSSRGRATWTLGFAYQLQGDRAAARQAYSEAATIPQTSGNVFRTIAATTGLGQIQESDNQLHEAAESYRRSLQLFGDKEPPNASEEFIGLARILYEWNDLDTAEQYGQQSLQLARQYDPAIDRFLICEVFLARLALARGDVSRAAAMLAEIEQSVRQNNYTHRVPEVAAAQVLVLLKQGNLGAAAHLAQIHELPLSQARVYLARGEAQAALSVLEPLRRQMEAKGWEDERLKVMVVQSVALRTHGETDKALRLLGDALALAEPGGFIRLFLDEGEPMRSLLLDYQRLAQKQCAERTHLQSAYLERLLAAFAKLETMPQPKTPTGVSNLKSEAVEPLTERELDILRLIAQGLSNGQIGARLFLALNTVKGHNRVIFEKLQVSSRTEAIARARELGLL